MSKLKRICLLFFDITLWIGFFFYLLGGIQFRGTLRLTHLHSLWIGISCFYIFFRLIDEDFRFRKTSFGREILFFLESVTQFLLGKCDFNVEKRFIQRFFLVAVLYNLFLFIAVPWLRYWAFQSSVLDLGIFNNVIFNGSKTWQLITYIEPDQQGRPLNYFLNNHLNFGLWIFACIYRIFGPHIEILLTLQSLALLFSIILFVRLGDRVLPQNFPRWFPLVLIWFWQPTHRMNLWDFHETPFMVPLAFLSFLEFEKGKLGRAIFFAFLMALWREDGWWTFSAMMIYFAIRTGRWKILMPLSILGSAIFPLHFLKFNTVNSFGSRYGYLGSSLCEAISRVLSNPFILLKQVVSPLNSIFWGKLFLSTGGAVFLFAGAAMIPALPVLFMVGLAQDGNQLSWNNHYIGGFAAPILYATLKGWEKIWRPQYSRWVGISLALAFTQFAFLETGQFRDHLQNYAKTSCLREIVARVPDNYSVLSDNAILPLLTSRERAVLNTDNHVLGDRPWMLITRDEGDLERIGRAETSVLNRSWTPAGKMCGYILAQWELQD